MKPFYQGKLDNFCAAYAVLNALRLIRNITTLQARVVLNEMFHHETKDPDEWLKILNHDTDYQNLVKRMLNKWTTSFGYKTFCPFNPQDFISNGTNNAEAKSSNEATIKNSGETNIKSSNEISTKNMNEPEVDKDILWNTLMQYARVGESTVVMRFCRFVPNQIGPLVDHWTTLGRMTEDAMYFFDCSIEPSGWYTIPRHKLYVAPFGTLPPQSIGISQKLILSLDKEEFAIIPPENIHVLKVVKNPFDI